MTIFERVKETANLRKINLQTLAEKSGMGINSIYGWKTKTPSVEKISAVADVLNVSTDYLLGRTDEMNPAQSNNELSGFDEEIMMAFDGKPIPDEDKEKLLEFARFLRSQRGK
ncbi:helix-turn-helix domain-containing protein [Leuconostoc citreum]|uniref:helix-turn-helix domain-containing protein n=1 Tax=Leuconostoc citreum TaxID=33964 RepID=UPI00200B98FB|nr:helix-turn-helix transcriptional regulator [Leuconostoc citreum]MCK8605177.1 helix-turn-helix domain-containing protein [Leuconostoc citreum]